MAVIPAGVHVIGEVLSGEDLLVEGRIEGDVHVPDSLLTIADQAHVEADIRGRRISVQGTVRGSILASERIEMAASASVSGSLSADQVVLAEGAEFNGRIDMNRRTIAAIVARHKAGSA